MSFLAAAALLAIAVAEPRPTVPPAHSHHHADVDSRGDHVMGFDHEKTTHHFRLFPNGGVIEAQARDPKDIESRDQIRSHFRNIAKMFSEGDFEAPFLIHGQTPPGVPVLKQRKSEIRYDFEPTERGGRVVISTKSPQALTAIHDFLRLQIDEHRTGDSIEVAAPSRS